MRTVVDIVYGVAGQVLVFDAPEGRPSSVTSCQVFRWDVGDDDEAELAITGSPAIEANPNTTTDAAAGISEDNPRLIPVAATTGITPGREFLLVGADALREWVDVQEVDAGVSVTARHPLHNDYASGAALVSTRLTATVSTAWCSDDENFDPSSGPNPMFRVRWVYVVAGVTLVADTYFNLVRYAGRHGVRPQDVEDTLAGWLDALPTDHRVDQGRRLIDQAHRAVKIDVHEVNFAASAIAESEVVDELVRLKTIEATEYAKFLASSTSDRSRYELASEVYTKRLDALIRLTSKLPVRDQDGAAAVSQPLRLTVR